MARQYELDDDTVVVVVGSGAGGGTLANELAQKGVDVVCLEAGGWVHTEEIVNDESVMYGKLTWHDRRIGSGVLPTSDPVWSGKGVGGTTQHWTANMSTLRAHEFAPLTTYGRLDGANVIDWPLTLDDLQPYYHRAAKKMGATGTNGWPLLPEGNNFKVMSAGARRLGYRHMSTGTMAINSVFRDGRPPCQQLAFCKSGCALDAKWTTANSEIPKALDSGHFELRTNAMVLNIEHDAKGRASGVVYSDADGQMRRQKARVVVLAANAIDTPRLLLNSATAMFPDGLANGSGQVGRNYLRHMFGFTMAVMPGEVNYHRSTQNIGIIEDERGFAPERGFAGGFGFEGVAFSPASLARILMAGRWGREVADFIDNYKYIAGIMTVGEDIAMAGNRITLDARAKDRYGLPVPIVHYDDHPNTVAMRDFAQRRAADIFNALDARRVVHGHHGSSTHNMGTCRMSARPGDGVCDQTGRTHEIANLFIADGSLMTSPGGGNPTYSIVALAIRVADQIAGSLGRGEL